MGFKVSVREVDKGWDDLRRAFKKAEAGPDAVKVGVLDGSKNERDGEDTGLTNADLAIIHEFGAPGAGIPERSFVRSTFEANKPRYVEMLKKLARGVYDGKIDTERALGLVGAKMAADMKNKIRDGIPPPNAPATVARKGSSKPLVDTGQLLNSITWDVVKGGDDGSE